MHIHILGICGTFMAGIALLAKELGHTVSGSDENVYPPMSTQLANQGIHLKSGYLPEHLKQEFPDLVIVGNVIKRGNPLMEYILAHKIPFISGPEWLSKYVLQNRIVLAVAGTHGKTTTTSLLSWILEYAGKVPGFLIGGIPKNFEISARLGGSEYFVIEADEYDCAFFDKRSKFMHYHPDVLILNNLEFDHADIFPNLLAIKQQFHFLVRTVPPNGLIIVNEKDNHLKSVLKMGCWTPLCTFNGKNANFQAKLTNSDGSEFEVFNHQKSLLKIKSPLLGQHNVNNILAALAAADFLKIPLASLGPAITSFRGVKRRLEIYGEKNGITIYDDFAHHPTAIQTTLAGLRAKIGSARMIVLLEFGSFTMRSGIHKNHLKKALTLADQVLFKRPEALSWDLNDVVNELIPKAELFDEVDTMINSLMGFLKKGDHVIIMSNSGFGGAHQKLMARL